MTTNCIEALDPALIRAGRIDKQARFTNTSDEMAEQLLLCFFKPSPAMAKTETTKARNSESETKRPRIQLGIDDAHRLAKEFGKVLRGGEFKPAPAELLLGNLQRPRQRRRGSTTMEGRDVGRSQEA
ncbi:hypothetical protein F4825DRAFT_258300 [Nemania diffusa]|nr:hypothetical protein F4825DRAFT_258300 [Nemania diffusa]